MSTPVFSPTLVSALNALNALNAFKLRRLLRLTLLGVTVSSLSFGSLAQTPATSAVKDQARSVKQAAQDTAKVTLNKKEAAKSSATKPTKSTKAPSKQAADESAKTATPGEETPQMRDYIAAMVGSEPVMHSENVQRLEQMREQDQRLTDNAENRQRALDSLIEEKLIVLAARAAGEKVSDTELDQLIQQQAQNLGQQLADYRAHIEAIGQTWDDFRRRVREQVVATRYMQAVMRDRVKISPGDLDAAVKQVQNSMTAPTIAAIDLGHILVLLPKDKNNATALKEREQRIEKAWQRLQKGEDFATVARAVSEAAEGKRGGEIGLLPESEYPKEFLDAVAEVPPGAVSRIVRSNVGFHILKVLSRQTLVRVQNSHAQVPGTVLEMHVRHILLKAGDYPSAQAATKKLADVRKQIVANKLSFTQAAQQYSQDGSAEFGGILPWAGTGVFVPEFEKAVAELKPGELSQPVQTRFGVHLIQLMNTHRRVLTEAELRRFIEQEMQAERSEKAYQAWIAELRKNQFVEYRSAPL